MSGHTTDEARVQPNWALCDCSCGPGGTKCAACAAELDLRVGSLPHCTSCGGLTGHAIGCPEMDRAR